MPLEESPNKQKPEEGMGVGVQFILAAFVLFAFGLLAWSVLH